MIGANAQASGVHAVLARLSPRQRQFALLGAIVAAGVSLLWLVFALSQTDPATFTRRVTTGAGSAVTNIGVMPPGAQVNPVDQWVGTAGRKLAQYENEREEQGRLNKDRQAFESRTMQRFVELEQRLTSTQKSEAAAIQPPTMPATSPPPPTPNWTSVPPSTMPPAAALPTLAPPNRAVAGALMPNGPLAYGTDPMPAQAAPRIVHVTITARAQPGPSAAATKGATGPIASGDAHTVSTFLPVSFTRGTLLGGLDAPTGGQAQSNPHPVLIRLSDNSILPNRFRGQYRDCFVVAAGYGDISSERAYLRTESLSCVRRDGATLEVRIQGSVYGEDGKVGMRGRLVTKQGQMLANALLAGVVGGIGQGLASSNTQVSTSALGTLASSTGTDAMRSGVGTGVGRALDRLAQYYIKLAENTFPVIEIDAGRAIDVVITKGVRIDVPMAGPDIDTVPATAPISPESRFLEAPDDENY